MWEKISKQMVFWKTDHILGMDMVAFSPNFFLKTVLEVQPI